MFEKHRNSNVAATLTPENDQKRITQSKLQTQHEIFNNVDHLRVVLLWQKLVEQLDPRVDASLLHFDFSLELHDLLHEFDDCDVFDGQVCSVHVHS